MRSNHLLALLAAAGLATGLPIHAETIYGLTVGNNPTLVTFDSATPSAMTLVGAVTGVFAEMKLNSIDFRPADGKLYALAVGETEVGFAGLLYTIDTHTAVASSVGRAFLFGDSPDLLSIDFNPVVDRLRVVSRSGVNFRINPDSGAITAVDTELSVTNVRSIAYANNQVGATQTTLYSYSYQTDELATIGGLNGMPSPNSGVVNAVGSTGVTASTWVPIGFDIGASGQAYLSLDDNGSSSYDSEFYTVNLATGHAQFVGEVPLALQDIAVSSVPEPTSMALWLIGIAGLGAAVRRREAAKA